MAKSGMGSKMNIGAAIGDFPTGNPMNANPTSSIAPAKGPKKKKKFKKTSATKGTRDKSMPFQPKKSFSPNAGY